MVLDDLIERMKETNVHRGSFTSLSEYKGRINLLARILPEWLTVTTAPKKLLVRVSRKCNL